MGNKQIIEESLNLKEEVIKHKATIGVKDDKFYYGFWLPCTVTYIETLNKDEQEKEGIKTRKVKKVEQRLAIINSDKQYELITNGDLWKGFSKDLLRIDKKELEKWLDDGGEYQTIDGNELFEEIKKKYKEYIDLYDQRNFEYMALFDIASYFFPLFKVAPYVHVQGFKSCGKTKLMQCSSLISFNGKLMSSFTIATVFRYVDECSPTLYIDEADKLLKSEKEGIEEVVAMFNSGYKSGAKVPRCNKEGQVEWFDVYCPKVFGSINEIPSDFASRCHKIIMVKSNGGQTNSLIDEHAQEWEDLRTKLYFFALQNWKDVKGIYKELKNDTKLVARGWEIYKPILTIAKLISEECYADMVSFVEETYSQSKEEDLLAGGWETILLKSIGFLCTESKYYMVSEIRQFMAELTEEGSIPSGKWICNALRKHGFIEFGLTSGRTRVLMNPQHIQEVLTRNSIDLGKKEMDE